MKRVLVFLLIIFTTISLADYRKILFKSWKYYKKNKIDMVGRPLADFDRKDLSKGSVGKEVTYSESASYVLFRSVLMDDQKTFDKVWDWSVNNLMRKNISKVFNWQSSRWEDLPRGRNDYLFAWRYTPNIKRTNIGGVVYVPDDDYKNKWRNGFDAAPDGDQLIAGALIMAHNKWGSKDGQYNYRNYAKNIVSDIWNKCVMEESSGVVESFDNEDSIKKWFLYKSNDGEVLKDVESEGANMYMIIDTLGAEYFGVGKYLAGMDASGFDGLKFKTKNNPGTKIILEDIQGKRVKLEVRYPYSENFEEAKVDFRKFAHSDFNFASIKNIIFEPLGESFVMDDLKFIVNNDGSDKKRYHLLANDRGEPWLNMSYYMPFLYVAFSKIDPTHPWLDLMKDSLADIEKSKTVVLRNQQGQIFKGNGALIPDWCMLGKNNEFQDLPWAIDGKVDDYLYSWDAFRTWYFLAVTKSMFPNNGLDKYLKGKTYDFFTEKIKTDKRLTGGYAIDGTNLKIRSIQMEYPSTTAVYLAYFTALNDSYHSDIMLKKLDTMYRSSGYWGNEPKDYYKQNWAWLGLDFYVNRGRNIADLLRLDELGSIY